MSSASFACCRARVSLWLLDYWRSLNPIEARLHLMHVGYAGEEICQWSAMMLATPLPGFVL